MPAYKDEEVFTIVRRSTIDREKWRLTKIWIHPVDIGFNKYGFNYDSIWSGGEMIYRRNYNSKNAAILAYSIFSSGKLYEIADPLNWKPYTSLSMTIDRNLKEIKI